MGKTRLVLYKTDKESDGKASDIKMPGKADSSGSDHEQDRSKSAETCSIAEAAAIIAHGGLVAFPTETVYGLGADALNAEAVRKIYEAKGRPSDNPTIVHVADKEDLARLTSAVTKNEQAPGETPMEGPLGAQMSTHGEAYEQIQREALIDALADAFWPGPLTMVVPKLPDVPYETTGGLETVGVRMPRSEAALELIRRSGCPIAAPSANLSGRPSPTTAQHVIEDLDGKIEAIIDGGHCDIGIESTVLDLTGDVPMILRPGYITKEDLESVLGCEVAIDPALLIRPAGGSEHHNTDIKSKNNSRTKCDFENDSYRKSDNDGNSYNYEEQIIESLRRGVESDESSFRPKAPGMKYKHYAPKAKMILFMKTDAGEDSSDISEQDRVEQAMLAEKARLEEQGKKVAMILYGKGEEAVAARDFFGRLREADDQGVDVILASALPEDGPNGSKGGLGFSVMNRMLKAAGYNIRYVR